MIRTIQNGLLVGVIAGLALNVGALAQAVKPTPRETALTNRVAAEVNANLECSTAAVALAEQVQSLQAKLAKFEADKPKD